MIRYGWGNKIFFAFLCFVSAIRGFTLMPSHTHDQTASHRVLAVWLSDHEHDRLEVNKESHSNIEKLSVLRASEVHESHASHSQQSDSKRHCSVECTSFCSHLVILDNSFEFVPLSAVPELIHTLDLAYRDGFPQGQIDPPRFS
jgi:hypothetical protein